MGLEVGRDEGDEQGLQGLGHDCGDQGGDDLLCTEGVVGHVDSGLQGACHCDVDMEGGGVWL